MNDIHHIRTGPPGPGETAIPDDALAYVILGCFRAAVEFQQFPVKVDHIKDNLDEDGIIQSFTIVTASGLEFITHVTHVERPPVPNTKEENIAFRKDWDDAVEKGQS